MVGLIGEGPLSSAQTITNVNFHHVTAAAVDRFLKTQFHLRPSIHLH